MLNKLNNSFGTVVMSLFFTIGMLVMYSFFAEMSTTFMMISIVGIGIFANIVNFLLGLTLVEPVDRNVYDWQPFPLIVCTGVSLSLPMIITQIAPIIEPFAQEMVRHIFNGRFLFLLIGGLSFFYPPVVRFILNKGSTGRGPIITTARKSVGPFAQ